MIKTQNLEGTRADVAGGGGVSQGELLLMVSAGASEALHEVVRRPQYLRSPCSRWIACLTMTGKARKEIL